MATVDDFAIVDWHRTATFYGEEKVYAGKRPKKFGAEKTDRQTRKVGGASCTLIMMIHTYLYVFRSHRHNWKILEILYHFQVKTGWFHGSVNN